MRLPLTPAPARSLRRRLLAFYDTGRRDLPWRRTRDPYRILVSEMMLQQTTVATVIPYYQSFLERFPDIGALAQAAESDVLEAWAGLGYYRRARYLHAAARQVVARHGGCLPRTAAALRQLPGIGAYTAGAVASIAFELPEPILDGNVVRVLSRLAARAGQGAAERRLLAGAAAELVQGARPGDLNQALMDLGATVCTPRAPRCPSCPLRRSCAARAAGASERYPAAPPRPASERRQGVFLLALDRRGRVLLARRPRAGLMAGMWQLPGLSGQEAEAVRPTSAALGRAAAEQTGRWLRPGKLLARISHGVLNRRVEIEVRAADLHPGRLRRDGAARFIDMNREPVPALTGAARKALAAAGYNAALRRRSL